MENNISKSNLDFGKFWTTSHQVRFTMVQSPKPLNMSKSLPLLRGSIKLKSALEDDDDILHIECSQEGGGEAWFKRIMDICNAFENLMIIFAQLVVLFVTPKPWTPRSRTEWLLVRVNDCHVLRSIKSGPSRVSLKRQLNKLCVEV